ncbi:MAG TPA: histidine kinase [Candidatus Saccharimonadales bacterium]|nr:histidine kinase [Candidatus Saccharimonadales bacterium]
MPPPLLKKRSLRWLLAFLLWTLIGFCFAGQLYLSRAKIGQPVSWGFAIGRALSDWYVFALLSIPALWLARRFRIERGHWANSVIAHIFGSVLFSVGWMAVRALLEKWQSGATENPVSFSDAFSHALVATFFFNLLIYAVVVSISHTASYYTKYQDHAIQSAELEKRLTESRLQALQMQLNPHFLFNTLHAISSLMHKDVDAADRMIARLSDLLRYALESTNEQEVTLRQEIEFLDRYLEIEQTRFGARLQVVKKLPPETLQVLVPNLILQPIIENAIRHGIEPHARQGIIEISSKQENGELVMQVRDNGSGLNPQQPRREGVGLSNSRARLEQLHPGRHRFEFASDRGLLVTVAVPWRTASANSLSRESEALGKLNRKSIT